MSPAAYVCILSSVHDLNRFIDQVQRERGHSFGQDSCGAGFIPVLTLSEKRQKTRGTQVKLVMKVYIFTLGFYKICQTTMRSRNRKLDQFKYQ